MCTSSCCQQSHKSWPHWFVTVLFAANITCRYEQFKYYSNETPGKKRKISVFHWTAYNFFHLCQKFISWHNFALSLTHKQQTATTNCAILPNFNSFIYLCLFFCSCHTHVIQRRWWWCWNEWLLVWHWWILHPNNTHRFSALTTMVTWRWLVFFLLLR